MSDAKYFAINVKGKEAKVNEIGVLDKKTGMPTGPTTKVKGRLGLIAIPNYSSVWGKLEEKEGKLTGKVTFMDWGEEGGMPIEIRYLPSCSSLSKLYQDTVLKMVPRMEDGELQLQLGVNNYDPIRDAKLIEMIKHHTLNGDNKSRDPNKQDIIFWDYNPVKRLQSTTANIEIRRKAEGLVLDNQDNMSVLFVLAHFFEVDAKQPDEEIIAQLMEKVQEDPRKFLQVIADYQEKTIGLLQKALKYKLIDLRPDKEIFLIKGTTKEKLFTNVNAKGEDKIKWVASHQVEAKIYDAVRKLEGVIQVHETQMHG